MGNVLVVTEVSDGKIREASLEILSLARQLAESSGREVKSLVIGSGIGDAAADFASKGGGETYVVDDAAVANYNVDAYSQAILKAAETAGGRLSGAQQAGGAAVDSSGVVHELAVGSRSSLSAAPGKVCPGVVDLLAQRGWATAVADALRGSRRGTWTRP